MDKEQYQIIKNNIKNRYMTISTDYLVPFLKDRTLLFGKNNNGTLQHVYLKDMQIHTIRYRIKDGVVIDIQRIQVNDAREYVPDIIYPESCDYRFISILQKKWIDLNFEEYGAMDEKAIYPSM